MKKLEGKELYRRLQEAKNYKKLYEAQKQMNLVLKERLKTSEQINALQEKRINTQEEMLRLQGIRIEYLEKIVFGKSKKNKDDDHKNDKDDNLKNDKKEKVKRTKESYQREIPQESEITNVLNFSINDCNVCGTELINKKTYERYVEDIIFPKENLKNPLKTVVLEKIKSGYCKKCKQYRHAKDINGSKVILGENVKVLAVYLNIVMRQSYAQIINMFKDIYWIKLTDGEIANILETNSNKLLDEYQKIDQRINKQEGTHYDETTYKNQKTVNGGNYAWVKTGTETSDLILKVGQTRGIGNAEKLKGENNKVAITDDYGAYKNLFENHQLCWAHPLRKFRDLKDSQSLTKIQHDNCKSTYEKFAKLFKETEKINETPLSNKQKHKSKLFKKMEIISKIKKNDPSKLITYKETLNSNIKKYFTCLDFEKIPMTNNKAERSFRHLVLKRKTSFGVKTDKGAKTLEILYSVVMSLWRSKPQNFFASYQHLLENS